MKKFTKGCLLTALVIFVIGCVICIVCGLLGGFKQLENISETTGIPFRYYRGNDGSVQFGFYDNDWDNDWEEYSEEAWETMEANEDVVQTQLDLTADTLRKLEAEIGACGLFVQESEDDHVWIAVEGNTQAVHYSIENGNTLIIETSYDSVFGWFDWREKGKNAVVYLSLPQGAALEEVDLEFGAGEINIADLQADDIDIEFGAGICNVEALKADSVSLSVGAGQANIGTLTARETDLEVGAGELVVYDVDVIGSMDLDIGMGNAEIYGTVTGDLDADCSMGNLTMQLTGAEEDHSYYVDCAMGSVTVGGHTYAAIGDSVEWGNRSNSRFDIDCSMGNVTIVFDESKLR